MFFGHLPELIIILVMLVVLIGAGYLLIRIAAQTAGREYARARTEEERRQRRQPR